MEFAREYIESSENIENDRAKEKITRVSIERLCAGPAIPLMYEFFAKKHSSLERTLETQGGK
jgi:glucokinase